MWLCYPTAESSRRMDLDLQLAGRYSTEQLLPCMVIRPASTSYKLLVSTSRKRPPDGARRIPATASAVVAAVAVTRRSHLLCSAAGIDFPVGAACGFPGRPAAGVGERPLLLLSYRNRTMARQLSRPL